MYQCVVRRQEGDTFQASAELQLGGKKQFMLLHDQFDSSTFLIDAPPVLLYSFIEQTLQPGPAVSLKCSATGTFFG